MQLLAAFGRGDRRVICMGKTGTPGQKQSSGSFPKITSKPGLRAVHLNRTADIFSVDGVLTKEEADQYIRLAEARGFERQGSRGLAFGEAFRDNGRIAFHDASLANNLWRSGVGELFNVPFVEGRTAVGLNPNFRLYRYVKGQKFGPHVDESMPLGPDRETLFTVLIYLSGDGGKKLSGGLRGGSTVFYGHKGKVIAKVEPLTGMALFHLHGDGCMEHEALEVTSAGAHKYVLRTDVAFSI